MWRLIFQKVIIASMKGLAAFLYNKWQNIRTKNNKEKITKLETERPEDDKELLDQLSDIDSNL